jgi:hypothetical protein
VPVSAQAIRPVLADRGISSHKMACAVVTFSDSHSQRVSAVAGADPTTQNLDLGAWNGKRVISPYCSGDSIFAGEPEDLLTGQNVWGAVHNGSSSRAFLR